MGCGGRERRGGRRRDVGEGVMLDREEAGRGGGIIPGSWEGSWQAAGTRYGH